MLRPSTLQLRGGARPTRDLFRKNLDSDAKEEDSQSDEIDVVGDENGEDDDANEEYDESENDPEVMVERERSLRREVEANPYDQQALSELANFLWDFHGDKDGTKKKGTHHKGRIWGELQNCTSCAHVPAMPALLMRSSCLKIPLMLP
jgi:hypothetical protein